MSFVKFKVSFREILGLRLNPEVLAIAGSWTARAVWAVLRGSVSDNTLKCKTLMEKLKRVCFSRELMLNRGLKH